MINVQEMTPAILSKMSRDYQVFCSLFTMLYNDSKSYADHMDFWSTDIDNKLVPLRAKTLNFDIDHTWDMNELEAITTCFKWLIMRKGTSTSIKYCLNLFARLQGNTDWVNDVEYEDGMITIRMKKGTISRGQLEDLLKYLLPAGTRYKVEELSVLSTDPFRTYYAVQSTLYPSIRTQRQSLSITDTLAQGKKVSGKWVFDEEGNIRDPYQGKFSQMVVSDKSITKEADLDA